MTMSRDRLSIQIPSCWEQTNIVQPSYILQLVPFAFVSTVKTFELQARKGGKNWKYT